MVEEALGVEVECQPPPTYNGRVRCRDGGFPERSEREPAREPPERSEGGEQIRTAVQPAQYSNPD